MLIHFERYYEYDGLRQANLSGVEEVTVTESRTLEVYTIDGRAIRSVESLSELQRGVYIVNRRKVVIL